MSVGIDKLLRMARQIGDNLSIDDDSESTGQKLAAHMQRFWDPRMRANFLDYAGSEPGARKLDPVLAAAARHLRPAEDSRDS